MVAEVRYSRSSFEGMNPRRAQNAAASAVNHVDNQRVPSDEACGRDAAQQRMFEQAGANAFAGLALIDAAHLDCDQCASSYRGAVSPDRLTSVFAKSSPLNSSGSPRVTASA